MRENGIRRIWASGGAVVNGWLAIPSVFSAETMAHQGWDSLTVDMQHGVVDYQAAVAMLTAISTTAATPLVRVPWLDPGMVMKMLDAGAYGIICPMVNTVEDARRLVAACRYAPAGNRSYGPIRALLYAGQDYPEHANATVLPIAMIETAEAMANLDAILAVEGLGGIYVGPSDLALSLGQPPRFDVEEGPVREAIGRILDGARSAGVPAGIHTGSAAYALKMIAAGFRFVTIGSDARLMAAGAQAALKAMRADATPPAPRPGAY